MKFKVTYYDYYTDSVVTKDCHSLTWTQGLFEFVPVDNPVKIYESVRIDHPLVDIRIDIGRMKMVVAGYQYMKDGGYWKTDTIIENVRDN